MLRFLPLFRHVPVPASTERPVYKLSVQSPLPLLPPRPSLPNRHSNRGTSLTGQHKVEIGCAFSFAFRNTFNLNQTHIV